MVARESSITATIMRWLKAEGHCPLKWHGGPWGRSGVPDILCCVHGRTVWLEVKRPGGKPTALQLAMHEELRTSGATVHVVTSIEEVKEAVKSEERRGEP